jgi:hypothetical protein
VWGDPAVQKEIDVDGEIVQVGENLYEALRTLREIPEIQMGTPVLVDALCINQQDVEERNFEVRYLYKSATCDLVPWGGTKYRG